MTIEIAPLGNNQDDWPRLKEQMDICAYQNTIELSPGTWICRTKQRIPSGTHLVASPGVRVHQELQYTGVDFLNAAFSSGPIFGQVMTGALLENAALGGREVIVNKPFVAGNIVRLSRGSTGLTQLYYRVVSCVQEDEGIYVATLSRPVKQTFLAGDMIQSAESIPSDIRIEGNGMVVSGTGDRYLEIAAGLRCHVSGIRIDPSHGWLGTGGPAMSMDIGGYECSFSDCVVNSDGHPINAGCIIESGECCKIQGCVAEYAGVTGAGLYACIESYILDCVSTGCVYGAYIGSGSVECQVRGGSYWCNQQGVLVGGGKRNIISNVTSSYNTQCGIKIASGEQDSIVSDCVGVGNALKFLEVQPDCNVSINNVRS